MSKAQPQQARGFEYYNPQQQQQQQSQQPRHLHPQMNFSQNVSNFPPATSHPASPNAFAGPIQRLPNVQAAGYQNPPQFSDLPRPAPAQSDVEIMKKELEKSRGQVAQLEKTLKWWSDCTANWRDKWSKEKAERRKLKEELTQLRSSYDETISRELEKLKIQTGEGLPSKQAAVSTAGVGTGNSMQRSMEQSTIGVSIPTETTANFELQELLTETSSALEQEKSENAELKAEVERLHAEQNDLKVELNLLKDTMGTLNRLKETNGVIKSEEKECSESVNWHGLPKAANELLDSLQSKVDQLEKEAAVRQSERLSEWNVIDRLESDRAFLRSENELLMAKLEELEKNSNADNSQNDEFKVQEIESLRTEVHCLRRLVSRQTQELDHVNFLLSNQETETKLLRSRLLQPWGTNAQRPGNSSATSTTQS